MASPVGGWGSGTVGADLVGERVDAGQQAAPPWVRPATHTAS